MASREQRAARDLQTRTGWTYSECLRLVRLRTPEDAIVKLIATRKTQDSP